MRLKTLFIAPLITVTVAVAASAEEPPPGPWSGSAELSFVSTSGNTDTQTLGLGFELGYKPGVWTSKLKVGFIRSENEGELTAEKLNGLLSLQRSLSERFDVYGRTTYLKNEFAGVSSNWGLEAGALYNALTGDTHSLDLSAGLGYTMESRISEADRDFAMGTLGAEYKWKISETTDFANDFGFVHDFDDSDNWRIANATSLTTSMTKVLSLKVSYVLNYQNQPSVGFEERDAVTSVALVAKF